MIRRATRCAVVLLALVTTRAAAAPPTENDARQARQLYDEGMKHYDLAEFDAAVDLFKKAYALTSAAPLLFNLGQAARKKHDWETAKNFYQAYLRRLPDAGNRADVEKFIAEIDQQLASSQLPPVAVPVPPRAPARAEEIAPPSLSPASASAPAPSLTLGDAEIASSNVKLRVGLGLVGAGVVMVASGIYCGVRASDDEGQLTDLATRHGTWSAQYQSIATDGDHAATAATVLLVIGGVSAVVGGGLAIVGVRDRNLARRIAVAPIAGGGALLTFTGVAW